MGDRRSKKERSRCHYCDKEMTRHPRAKYDSDSCRQMAHIERIKDKRDELEQIVEWTAHQLRTIRNRMKDVLADEVNGVPKAAVNEWGGRIDAVLSKLERDPDG